MGGVEPDTELTLRMWRSSLRCVVSSCMDVCVLRFSFHFIFQAGCRPPGWLSILRCPRWCRVGHRAYATHVAVELTVRSFELHGCLCAPISLLFYLPGRLQAAGWLSILRCPRWCRAGHRAYATHVAVELTVRSFELHGCLYAPISLLFYLPGRL